MKHISFLYFLIILFSIITPSQFLQPTDPENSHTLELPHSPTKEQYRNPKLPPEKDPEKNHRFMCIEIPNEIGNILHWIYEQTNPHQRTRNFDLLHEEFINTKQSVHQTTQPATPKKTKSEATHETIHPAVPGEALRKAWDCFCDSQNVSKDRFATFIPYDLFVPGCADAYDLLKSLPQSEITSAALQNLDSFYSNLQNYLFTVDDLAELDNTHYLYSPDRITRRINTATTLTPLYLAIGSQNYVQLTASGATGSLIPIGPTSCAQDLGSDTNRWRDLYLSGTATMASILPASGCTYDLGASGARWKDLYLNGNIKMQGTSDAAQGVIEYDGNRFIHAQGTSNVFMGSGAGNFTLTGTRNIGIGECALSSDTLGEGNSAMGYQALQNNTTGLF